MFLFMFGVCMCIGSESEFESLFEFSSSLLPRSLSGSLFVVGFCIWLSFFYRISFFLSRFLGVFIKVVYRLRMVAKAV